MMLIHQQGRKNPLKISVTNHCLVWLELGFYSQLADDSHETTFGSCWRVGIAASLLAG